MTDRRLHFITIRAFDEGIAALDKVLGEIEGHKRGDAEIMTREPRSEDSVVAARGVLITAARNALDGMRSAVTQRPAPDDERCDECRVRSKSGTEPVACEAHRATGAKL